MSLMQLLTVGRSFGSVEDRPSPYRMIQENLLPKFGPADRSEMKQPPVETSVAAAPGDLGVRAGWADASKRSETKMNAIEIQVQAAPGASSALPPEAYPLGRWTTMRNPFHRRTASQKSPRLVQGELSLDAVRPVRNDLNESDLEVIPARVAEPGVSDEPVSTEETEGATGFLWNRLRARLLKRT
jgi:hypothetical protein